MSQRILIGTVVLLAIACLAASGFAWMAVQEGREVNRAMLENNRAMMEHLTSLALASPEQTKDESSHANVWVPLKFKLVKDTPDGPPAVGYRIRLAGKFVGTEVEAQIIEKTSDDNGVVDYDAVYPGYFVAEIWTPWNEHSYRRFNVHPNKPHVEKIVCPGKDIPDVDVQVVVDWPEDLRDLDLGLVCRVTQNERYHSPEESKKVEGQWHFENVRNRLPTGDRSGGGLWIDHDGEIAQLQQEPRASAFEFHNPKLPQIKYLMGIISQRPEMDAYIFNETLKLRALPVKILEMDVVLPTIETLAEKTGLVHSLDPLYSDNSSPSLAYWPLKQRRTRIPDSERAPTKAVLRSNPDVAFKELIIPDSNIFDEQPREFQEFVPKSGEKNVWHIQLPESLIARTREALKSLDEFKAEHAAVEAKPDGE